MLQAFRNRVRVSRVERARMVCHVWCVRALDGLLWASSGITARDLIVGVDTVMNRTVWFT